MKNIITKLCIFFIIFSLVNVEKLNAKIVFEKQDTIYILQHAKKEKFNKDYNITYLNVDRDPFNQNISIGRFVNMTKKYPKEIKKEDIQGNVVNIQFIINKKGIVENPIIVKNASPSLDTEALRVIDKIPKQVPAIKWGKYVPVQLIYSVTFPKIKQPDNVTSTNGYWLAEFPDGEIALLAYLQNNLKYPQSVADERLTGLVLIGFYISEEGKILNPKILKNLHPDCDSEALRVIQNMPDWTPALNKGEPVKSYFTLPINFNIER